MTKPPVDPEKAALEGSSGDLCVRQYGKARVVPRFDFRIDFCSATRMGSGRSVNEDSLLCCPQGALFGIADGMGGHAAGEVASALAVEVAEREIRSKGALELLEIYAKDPEIENRREVFGLLNDAVFAAHRAVIAAAKDNEAYKGMGTTLDLVLLVRNRAFVAHVGDSRAYLIRPTATLQLTHDHALFDSLRTSGKRSRSARFSKSPLTNSIGHREQVTVDTLFVDISAGDRIMVCTDGVFNALDNESAFAKLCRTGTVRDACEQLIASAHAQDETDDASVMAIHIGERFVTRRGDAGPRARDIEVVSRSPLLSGLPTSAVLSTLAAGVEVELDKGKDVPRTVASDRVAYLVLDGLIKLPNERMLGASGLLNVESLLDVTLRGELPVVVERVRLLRIRHDDFVEVCSHDTALAARLYRRIAKHLATVGPTPL